MTLFKFNYFLTPNTVILEVEGSTQEFGKRGGSVYATWTVFLFFVFQKKVKSKPCRMNMCNEKRKEPLIKPW